MLVLIMAAQDKFSHLVDADKLKKALDENPDIASCCAVSKANWIVDFTGKDISNFCYNLTKTFNIIIGSGIILDPGALQMYLEKNTDPLNAPATLSAQANKAAGPAP